MNPVLCPRCHAPLDPALWEEARADAERYVVCPECDTPFPAPIDLPPSADKALARDRTDA